MEDNKTANNYNTGMPMNLDSIPKEEKSLAISQWGEGCQELEDVLRTCAELGIQTTASCKGHSLFDNPYVTMVIRKQNVHRIFNIMQTLSEIPGVRLQLDYQENKFNTHREDISVLVITTNMLNRNKVFRAVTDSLQHEAKLGQLPEGLQELWKIHRSLRANYGDMYHSLEYRKGLLSTKQYISPFAWSLHDYLNDSKLKKKRLYMNMTSYQLTTKEDMDRMKYVIEKIEGDYHTDPSDEFADIDDRRKQFLEQMHEDVQGVDSNSRDTQDSLQPTIDKMGERDV